MLTRRDLLSTAAASGAAVAATTLPGHRAEAAVPRQVVVMAKQIDDIVSLDPGEAYEFSDNEMDGNVYRKLIAPDPVNGTKLVGDLAEKWDTNEDGSGFTFHLRKDARFASGNPVTADDVVFSMARVVKMNKAPAFIITQFGFTPDNVEKMIVAADPHTVKMTLPQPAAPSFVLYCLSANVGNVVEKAEVLKHQENNDFGNAWLKNNSAGAGPYKLTSWLASDHIILDRNPHSGMKANEKRIVIRHVKDPAAQLLLLTKGDADIARDLTPDQLRSIAGNKAFHLTSASQMTSMYIAMNQNVPNLAKREVQQAIKWAIGYDAIAKNITPNVWSVDQSFLPKGLPGALTEQPFHKDTAKAKALLKQAGLADGFLVTMDYISDTPYAEIAQAIQADLGAAGIKVQLLPGEQKQVITKTRARTHQLAILVWGSDYFDPNSNAQAFCANPDDSDNSKLKIIAWRSHFVDKELTEEAFAAAKENDAAKRVALYQKMQRQFWDRAPFAFILQKNEVATLRQEVSGLHLGPMPDYTKYAPIRKA